MKLETLAELKASTPTEEYRTTRGQVATRYSHCVVCGDPLDNAKGHGGRQKCVCADEICKRAYLRCWRREQAQRLGRWLGGDYYQRIRPPGVQASRRRPCIVTPEVASRIEARVLAVGTIREALVGTRVSTKTWWRYRLRQASLAEVTP